MGAGLDERQSRMQALRITWLLVLQLTGRRWHCCSNFRSRPVIGMLLLVLSMRFTLVREPASRCQPALAPVLAVCAGGGGRHHAPESAA